MTTLAAPTGNEIQNTLAATYTRGTDTDITLTDGADFPNSAHVIRISESSTKWCLIIYTTKATHVLTMGGGAADYALANNYVTDGTAVFAIGSTVELVCAADEIAQLFTNQALRTSAAAVIVDHSLVRGDGGARGVQDTGITVDDSDNLSMPDATYIKTDEVRAFDGAGLKLYEDGGTKGIFVSDAGIVSIANQSGVQVSLYNAGSNQDIPASSYTKVMLDSEIAGSDPQNEMDSAVIRSTATASTTGTALYDSSNPFVVGDVGKTVWNVTDGGYTTIAGYTDAGHVTLTADINLDSTDVYRAYFARFTLDEAGNYFIRVQADLNTLDAAARMNAAIYIDGSEALGPDVYNWGAGAVEMIVATSTFLTLAANSYIEFFVRHTSSGDEELIYATSLGRCSMIIQKVT